MVGVYYRLPDDDEGEPTEKALLGLQVLSGCLVLTASCPAGGLQLL